jgi:hypothetical protein
MEPRMLIRQLSFQAAAILVSSVEEIGHIQHQHSFSA